MSAMRAARVDTEPRPSPFTSAPPVKCTASPVGILRRTHQKKPHRQVYCPARVETAAPPLQRILAWVHETMKRERVVLTSNKADLQDIRELADLWAEHFDRPELLDDAALEAVQTALDQSFTVQFAFLETTSPGSTPDSPEDVTRTLIGCARSISDGYFAAQVVDVCVADEHRRKGLGSQMLKELCKDTREKGAQSIAVFTGPSNRLFFWRSGFRLDFRYKVMVYRPLKANKGKEAPQEASVSDLDELFGTRYM